MTPGEKIAALLEERRQQGKNPHNITQLARVTGIARESISRRVNDKVGLTRDYAERLAPALDVAPEDLLPPSVEPVTLTSVDRRLEALEEKLDDSIQWRAEVIEILREVRGKERDNGGDA